eukprot:TRINITY_DN379_c2_g1_i2.p1 TRINITY_DN379_c2_g1~~TRINITY_DN379_c2_g1_i2.p1  ORF type:complete len:120 (-),score=53.33 TRINITY_DN379_c2_g1_i2:90-449(-)
MELEIMIETARELEPSRRLFFPPNVVIKVFEESYLIHETPAIVSTTPTWDSPFRVNFSAAKELIFEIYDKHSITDDEFLGRGKLQLKEDMIGKAMNIFFEDKKSRKIDASLTINIQKIN